MPASHSRAPADAAPEVSPEAPANTEPEALETALDGVRYARLAEGGACWRLGSVSPLWREEAAGLGPAPDEAALAALAGRGIWLARDAASPPLAVICCGLGSGWPGMGRELYDNFPAARDAMDRVAALADWDILGLMDETDVEAISDTRRQIPYLFLLEYAQWSQFASLGVRPALFCGHSLGELIALSLSGIYGLAEAWYILDTRAEHMAELEAAATRDTGMMAVHAESAVVDEVLAAWPDLYVSNRNTPRQFILSGPRQSLTEARASLRKRRVPSMLLNVNLAFHHPGMRILRDLSQRRLGALEMRPAAVPMLSGITAGYYPDDQPSICRYITDLDENTVAWTDCVDAMWRRDGIRHFLELGPQDTLCGLVADCEPRALCLSAGRKGHEVAAMREACARLFALGHLSPPVIRKAAALRRAPKAEGEAAPAQATAAAQAVAVPPERLFGADGEQAAKVLDLLAEASGRPAAELRPEQDLRYDLALRSSRFPLLLQEAERRLGVRVEFEALLKVTTVGDLVAVLLGRGEARGDAAQQGRPPARNRRLGPFAPLLRFAPSADGDRPAPLPLDPAGAGPGIRPGGVYVLCVLDGALLPEIWGGLGSFAATLAVPPGSVAACAPLARAGSRVVPLEMDAPGGPDALGRALDALLAAEGRLDGVLLAPTAADLAPGLSEDATDAAVLAEACGAWCARHAPCWFAALRRWQGAPAAVAGLLAGEDAAGAARVTEGVRALAD
ncbi:acyltransferase domain-containing protein, partial [Desulfovibrio sp.]|uniref:acyltransferase domain-containing protein n=1 Tax=Desulfovibrio sp. TaxID=885 RepID=UPI0023BDC111